MSQLTKPTTLFSKSLDDYKRRLWVYVGITIIPAALFVLLVAYNANFVDQEQLQRQEITGALLVENFLFVGLLLIQVLSQAALIYSIKENNLSVKEAYAKAFKVFSSFLWISILLSLVVLAGLVALIIPGIIFFVWFAFAVYVFIEEGTKGKNALRRSKEYVKGRWWAVFGRLTFIGAVLFAFSLGATILVSMSFVAFGANLENPSSENQVLLNAVQSLVTAFIAPLWAIYMYKLYSNLRRVKEEDASNSSAGEDAAGEKLKAQAKGNDKRETKNKN